MIGNKDGQKSRLSENTNLNIILCLTDQYSKYNKIEKRIIVFRKIRDKI